jgi:competence protein ComFB
MAKFDSIYNYHENLVFDRIDQQLLNTRYANDKNFYDDVACISLNQLPSHYVRHSVDAGFYMSSEEHAKIAEQVSTAVKEAIAKVKTFRAGPDRTLADEQKIQEETEAAAMESSSSSEEAVQQDSTTV